MRESEEIERETLWQLNWFKVAVLVPISLSLIVSAIILCSGDYSFRGDHVGFNNFLEYFKAPIQILFLIFPFVAIVVANHRSVQTYHQLQGAKKQLTESMSHNKMSIKPWLTGSSTRFNDHIKYEVSNKGLGTAIVTSFSLFDQNREIALEELWQALESLKPDASQINGRVIQDGTVLSKDDTLDLFTIKLEKVEAGFGRYDYSKVSINELQNLVDTIQGKFYIVLRYKSLYGETETLKQPISFL